MATDSTMYLGKTVYFFDLAKEISVMITLQSIKSIFIFVFKIFFIFELIPDNGNIRRNFCILDALIFFVYIFAI